MALITCSECSQQISTEAKACPHCGAVKSSGGSTFRFWVLSIVGALILLSCIGNERGSSSVNTQTPSERASADEGAARAQALARVLKKSARNPDRFEIDEAFVMSGTNVVCMKFRSENGFGGMSFGQALLQPDGETIVLETDPNFAEKWATACSGPQGRNFAGALNLIS
jgi:hypothetical protein